MSDDPGNQQDSFSPMLKKQPAECGEVSSISKPKPSIWLFSFPPTVEKEFQKLKWF